MRAGRLAGRLRAARAQAGITQAELARRIGCSRSAIADYETGRAEPSPGRLAEIAAALGTPLAAFFPQRTLPLGEPLHILTPSQALDIHRRRRGRPRKGGWLMARPEQWSERIGTMVWVEARAGSPLADAFPPGTVLGIVQGLVIPGARVVAVIRRELMAGELGREGQRQVFLGTDGAVRRIKASQLFGSIAVVVEAAAARAMAVRGGRGRKPAGTRKA